MADRNVNRIMIAAFAAALGACSSSGSDDDAGNAGGGPPAPSVAGQVVFTEIMANPDGADTDREWFELRNDGAETFNLRDCVVSDASTNNLVVDVDLVIDVDQYRTFASSAAPGFVPDFDFAGSGVTLTNSNETLTLTCSGVTIDTRIYVTSTEGQSSALSADGSMLWCDDAVNIYDGIDRGTPGAVNLVCP